MPAIQSSPLMPPLSLSNQVDALFHQKKDKQSSSPTAPLEQFLKRGEKSFENSVTRFGMHYKSAPLKYALSALKTYQEQPSAQSLNQLSNQLSNWETKHPAEFKMRGAKVAELRQEIALERKKFTGISAQDKAELPPLSKQAAQRLAQTPTGEKTAATSGADALHEAFTKGCRTAGTNKEMLAVVHETYGPQAWAALVRTAPELNTNDPLHHTALDKVSQVMSSQYFQNFKVAEKLVSAAMTSPDLDAYALSVATTELAKLPQAFLQVLEQSGHRCVLSDDIEKLVSAMPSDLADAVPKGEEGQATKGFFLFPINTTVIGLEKKQGGSDWQADSMGLSNNAFLHETGHALDMVLSSFVTVPGLISAHAGFENAWKEDKKMMENYYSNPDNGCLEAFAEGMANTFHDTQPTGKWPHVESYLQNLASHLAEGNNQQL